MTLRELNQLRYLRREIQLLGRYIVKYDAELYPGAALHREKQPVLSEDDVCRIEEAKQRVAENRKRCIAEVERLESYIDTVNDSLIRMAMRLRFIDGLGWNAVAISIGGGNTADGVKKMVYRYLEKEKK